jgi:predicted naringenin-chalcone synthase
MAQRHQSNQGKVRPTWAGAGLAALLMSSGAISTAAIATTMVLTTPQAAQAYVAYHSLFLSRDRGEPYENFLRRAEIIARAGVQRSFDADLLVTEVDLVVVAENQGISLPAMDVRVTRNQWRNNPDVQYWATYYESAANLLGL